MALWLLAAIELATLAVAAAIFALLVRRLRRPPPPPRPAAPPAPPARPRAHAVPPPPPAPELPSLGLTAWGGPYDDGETQPESIEVPPEFRPIAARLHDPDAITLRRYPPAPPPGPATTMATTVGQIADAIEGDAKRLRESSAGTKVPAEFRSLPTRREIEKKK